MRLIGITLAAALALGAGAATAQEAAPAEEKKICKRSAEIGSLVKKRKQCHTKAEWEKLAEANQSAARRMADAAQQHTGSRGPEGTE